jgi:hypothetical protein
MLSQSHHIELQFLLSRKDKRHSSPRVRAELEEQDHVSLDYPQVGCVCESNISPKMLRLQIHTPTNGHSRLSSPALATSAEAPASTAAATRQDSHPGRGSLPLSEQTHAHGAEMFG